MQRECAHCHRPFAPKDLVRETSKGMEGERKALGLQGVSFRYYCCPECGYADIFVDVRRLSGESEGDFHGRRDELEQAVRQVHAERAEIIITTK
jgi:hypothetical protein